MAIGTLDRTPSEREIRWFGLLLLAIFSVLGGVAFFHFSSARTAALLCCTGVVIAIVHAAFPPLRLPIYQAWMSLVTPIGWAFSHLVLAVIYFGIITPTALIGRMFRRDKLERRFDRAAESYWALRDPGDETASYFRQS